MLQKPISLRHVQPTTVQKLRHAIIVEWAHISHHKVRRLINSMRRRCQVVINPRGQHTRYSTPYANHFLICKIFFIPQCDIHNVDFRNTHMSRNTSSVIIFIKINFLLIIFSSFKYIFTYITNTQK
jgi:hypothetical protein